MLPLMGGLGSIPSWVTKIPQAAHDAAKTPNKQTYNQPAYFQYASNIDGKVTSFDLLHVLSSC